MRCNVCLFGGAKGGIKFDPTRLIPKGVDAISASFCKAIRFNIGSHVDIPAPDMGTNAHTMDVMTKAYNDNLTSRDFAVFTGKSVNFGGSLGREQATGKGVMLCMSRYAERHLQRSLAGMTLWCKDSETWDVLQRCCYHPREHVVLESEITRVTSEDASSTYEVCAIEWNRRNVPRCTKTFKGRILCIKMRFLHPGRIGTPNHQRQCITHEM